MKKKGFWKATVVIIVALAFIVPGSSISANKTLDNAIVSVDPSTQVVENGETFDVFVYVDPTIYMVAGIGIDFIYFDEALLQVDAVTLEGFFDPNPTMGSAGTIDNINGEITDIYEFTTDASNVTAANNFLKITFTAQQTIGVSDIDLEGVLVTDEDASPIPIEVNDGDVQIGQGYILTVTIEGNGMVTLDPAGGVYEEGAIVELTAVPDSEDWRFKEWSGDLTGSNNPETIIMDGDKDVTATFTDIDEIPPITEIIVDGPMGENGWYVGVVTVALVATDDWSGVESTWYRLDSGYWKLYNGPFEVNKEGYTIVEAYSFDFAGNMENPLKIEEFKIDSKSPVITHEFDGVIGDEGWFVSDVTVMISAEDVTSGVNYTMYKINSGIWINYTEPFNVAENGTYVLSYYSVDFAGNVETSEVEFKIEHDTVPPVTTHEFEGIIGDNDWYTSNVEVTLTAEDDSAGVDYTMYKLEDDTEWQVYPGPILITEGGEHTIVYYSVDRVGNKEDDKGPFAFKIDQTVPTIELTWDEDNLKLVADVSDEKSGIAKVEFYVNGEYLGEATDDPYEYEVTNPKRGDKAQAIVFDNAGNLKVSNEVEGQSLDQDITIRWTFLIGWVSNVEEAENTITAQAIRLRYIEIAPTGITVGFVNTKSVEFNSHNLLGRTLRSFGRMSLVFGIFKGGITIEG